MQFWLHDTATVGILPEVRASAACGLVPLTFNMD